MILTYGDCSRLKDTDWKLCELRSDKTVEATMRRLGFELPGIFHNEPIEVFIPVLKRDLDQFELQTMSYVFVRSTSFACLLRLKQITGIVALVTKDDSNRPADVISVSNEYVQGLIAQSEEQHRNQAQGIEVGSFVRVLNGQSRDICGTVELIEAGRAVVRIIMPTKYVLLETPVRNLLNLSDVSAAKRVYYYCPLVEDLSEEQNLALIAEDLRLEEVASPPPNLTSEEPASAAEGGQHSRQRTVTALVKKLILLEGKHQPMEIARLVLEALKRGEIKPPKNLFIIYGIIKFRLMEDYFKHKDGKIKTYRDVVRKYGREYRFSAQQIALLDPDSGIPVNTPNPTSKPQKRTAGLLVMEAKRRGPKKRRKVASDKCGTCGHNRERHKVTVKHSWGRCHSCKCVRFKERPVKAKR